VAYRRERSERHVVVWHEGLPLSKAAKDGGTQGKTQHLILLGGSDEKWA